MKTICAFAPATIANLNVGFDVLGLALDSKGDWVELTQNGTTENRITEMINSTGLPTDVTMNCCTVVIQAMQDALQIKEGVDLRLRKGFSSGSGLGSSSASSAAAAYAYNELMGRPFSQKELIPFAAEGERIACGVAHIDNVAPAILGGMVLAHLNEGCITSLPYPGKLFATIFFPQIEVKTREARDLIQGEVPLPVVSNQIAYTAMFVSSLYDGDMERMKRSMKDLVIEPRRSSLIPEFQKLKQSMLENGAISFGISGSGPSVFALSESWEKAMLLGDRLREVYRDTGISSEVIIEELKGEGGARLAKFEEQ